MTPAHLRLGDVLHRPAESDLTESKLAAFASHVATTRGADFGKPPDYDRIWRWSVDAPEQFWGDLAEWSGLLPAGHRTVLSGHSMPGATWFPDDRLNFAAAAFAPLDRGLVAPSDIAVIARDETGQNTLTWVRLRDQVAALAHFLRTRGVQPGDRVVGYLPNCVEALIALLASAAVGAIWSCCSPEFGSNGVIDRFAQLRPKILIAVNGYRFRGRLHDRAAALRDIRAALPMLEHSVVVDRTESGRDDQSTWEHATGEAAPLQVSDTGFGAPLWVVFSSGTTGTPKGIVHSHGGVALEVAKLLGLHLDLRPHDRFFWFASTSWIMWNILAGGLLVGATVVLYDGAPAYPTIGRQFEIAADARATFLGTSAGYLSACEKAGLRPGDDYDLTRLRAVGSTGSPLPVSTFGWVYDAVRDDISLASVSGGTDIGSAFLGTAPNLPVTAGELQRPMLGVAAECWNDDGVDVTGRVGELVITKPVPSMPIAFWADADGSRYHDAYFATWPGVWKHGDWVERTEHGTWIVTGRSDATLNRAGVRMGTADIYAAIAQLPEIVDSLVVGIDLPDGEYWMPLFVRLARPGTLSGELCDRIKEAIRSSATPRHVPDDIIECPGVPYTKTGKRIEVPLKRLLTTGEREAVKEETLANPETLDFFARLARIRSTAQKSG